MKKIVFIISSTILCLFFLTFFSRINLVKANSNSDCSSFSVSPRSGASNATFQVSGSGCLANDTMTIRIDYPEPDDEGNSFNTYQVTSNSSGTFSFPISALPAEGSHQIVLLSYPEFEEIAGPISIIITDAVSSQCGDIVPANSTNCPAECPATRVEQEGSAEVWRCGGEGVSIIPFEICNQIPEGDLKSECETCYDNGDGGIWTAVGCIQARPEGIVKNVMQIGLSIAGGVALLMILAAGFLFSTSQGDPKRTSQAKELLSSAVIGLLFIIFSVTILQFIGVTILQIPGFGES